jgi:hypothetical protein
MIVDSIYLRCDGAKEVGVCLVSFSPVMSARS